MFLIHSQRHQLGQQELWSVLRFHETTAGRNEAYKINDLNQHNKFSIRTFEFSNLSCSRRSFCIAFSSFPIYLFGGGMKLIAPPHLDKIQPLPLLIMPFLRPSHKQNITWQSYNASCENHHSQTLSSLFQAPSYGLLVATNLSVGCVNHV